jgi:hypothetical protein
MPDTSSPPNPRQRGQNHRQNSGGFLPGGRAVARSGPWLPRQPVPVLVQVDDLVSEFGDRFADIGPRALAKTNAVDMMDNADALTTCPQPKQTQLLAA